MANKISLPRGDTLRLELTIIDEATGQQYEPAENDKIVMTVKKTTNEDDTNVIIQKEITENQLVITHDDTKDLNYGNYYYDVQLTQANGDVTTVIKPTLFILTPEVNFDD